MPRPLLVDLLRILWPLGMGAIAMLAGRLAWRGPRAVRYLLVMVAAGGGMIVAASLAGIVSPAINETVAGIGGPAVVLYWMALLLLGVVWSGLASRWGSRVFVILASVLGGLILLDAGACLWWRFCASDLWQRTADAKGGLQQSTGHTCYPAAAVMLLHHYSIEASEGEMAYRANTTLFGTDEYAMARALTAKLHSRGWNAGVEATDYETCVRRGSPFIAHVDPPGIGEHAIFVRKALAESLEIIDPLDGVLTIKSRAAFEKVWGGTLVRITSDVEPVPP